MELLTDELRMLLPPLRATVSYPDPLAIVKYFTPWTSWTWYATEFDGNDLFFGLVVGFEAELGYFSLTELRDTRGPAGLRIERDLYFTATPLGKLMASE